MFNCTRDTWPKALLNVCFNVFILTYKLENFIPYTEVKTFSMTGSKAIGRKFAGLSGESFL